jgi:hypothetical protein
MTLIFFSNSKNEDDACLFHMFYINLMFGITSIAFLRIQQQVSRSMRMTRKAVAHHVRSRDTRARSTPAEVDPSAPSAAQSGETSYSAIKLYEPFQGSGDYIVSTVIEIICSLHFEAVDD